MAAFAAMTELGMWQVPNAAGRFTLYARF